MLISVASLIKYIAMSPRRPPRYGIDEDRPGRCWWLPLRSEASFVHRPFDLVGVNQRAARDGKAALCRMHVYIGARQSLIKGLLISWYPLSHYAGTRYIPFFIMPWARSRSLGTQSVHAWVVLDSGSRLRFGQQNRGLCPPRHHPLHTHIRPRLPATRPLLICHGRPLSPTLLPPPQSQRHRPYRRRGPRRRHREPPCAQVSGPLVRR